MPVTTCQIKDCPPSGGPERPARVQPFFVSHIAAVPNSSDLQFLLFVCAMLLLAGEDCAPQQFGRIQVQLLLTCPPGVVAVLLERHRAIVGFAGPGRMAGMVGAVGSLAVRDGRDRVVVVGSLVRAPALLRHVVGPIGEWVLRHVCLARRWSVLRPALWGAEYGYHLETGGFGHAKRTTDQVWMPRLSVIIAAAGTLYHRVYKLYARTLIGVYVIYQVLQFRAPNRRRL